MAANMILGEAILHTRNSESLPLPHLQQKSPSSVTNMTEKKVQSFAIVGVGSRASFYYSAITKDFTKTSKLVAFCDSNQ
jgi:hypothetical protein